MVHNLYFRDELHSYDCNLLTYLLVTYLLDFKSAILSDLYAEIKSAEAGSDTLMPNQVSVCHFSHNSGG